MDILVRWFVDCNMLGLISLADAISTARVVCAGR